MGDSGWGAESQTGVAAAAGASPYSQLQGPLSPNSVTLSNRALPELCQPEMVHGLDVRLGGGSLCVWVKICKFVMQFLRVGKRNKDMERE